MRRKYYKVQLNPQEIPLIQMVVVLSGGTAEESCEFGQYLSSCPIEDGKMKIEHRFMGPLWLIFSEANRTATNNPSNISEAVKFLFQRFDEAFY